MADRPHSRKVKVEEGTAEIKKGEKIPDAMRASERKPPEEKNEKQDAGRSS